MNKEPNPIDNWLPICDYCCLFDCIRNEGEFRESNYQRTERYEIIAQLCLIHQFQTSGTKPDEAILILEEKGKINE